MTGALTWNPNGSLYTLGITDTNQAANNQTCTYQRDDLARLSNADCGSGKWGQGFTYDAFGNIGKSQLSRAYWPAILGVLFYYHQPHH